MNRCRIGHGSKRKGSYRPACRRVGRGRAYFAHTTRTDFHVGYAAGGSDIRTTCVCRPGSPVGTVVGTGTGLQLICAVAAGARGQRSRHVRA